MSCRVLIVDNLSNRRIHLRAQLDSDCYEVAQAECARDGLAKAKAVPPDVMIVAHDVADHRLPHICKTLRSRQATRATLVIAAVPRDDNEARVVALNAGAADVIDYAHAQNDLNVRLRSLLRARQTREETRSHAGKSGALGMAEDTPAFEGPAQTVIVSCDIAAQAHALSIRLKDTGLRGVQVSTPALERRSPSEKTDVYVLIEAGNPMGARDLLGSLRAHPTARHASVLFVADCATRSTVASPLELGASDEVVAEVSIDEIALRINRLARRKRDADRTRRNLKALERNAYTDALTGLNNRQFAETYLGNRDRELGQHRRPFAILMIDVDRFKSINDDHGHPTGDAVLAHIAKLLQANLRDSDMLARYGGEEFVVWLPDVKREGATCVAERLRKAIADMPVTLDNAKTIRPTISVGLAFANRSSQCWTRDLVHAADQALLRAKAKGRNRVEPVIDQDYNAPGVRGGQPKALLSRHNIWAAE